MKNLALIETAVPGVAALLLFLLACDDGGRAPSPEAGLDGPDVSLTASTEEVFTVGEIQGDDWQIFGRVRAVSFDAAGRLYILDADAHSVMVVDPEGNLIRAVGKQGGGPGEFRAPYSMTVFQDGGMAVTDLGHQSLQIFGPDGVFSGSVPLDMTKGSPGERAIPLPDGRILSAGGPILRLASGPPDPDALFDRDQRRPVQRFSVEAGTMDVLYEAWDLPPAEAGPRRTMAGPGGNVSFAGPKMRAFEPELLFGVLSDGRVALVDSIGYRVKILGPDGSVGAVVERPVVPVQVTESIRSDERERRLAELEEGSGQVQVRVLGGSGGMRVDQDQVRRMMAEQIGEMVFADEVPVIVNMAVDREDRIWIARSAPDGSYEGPTDIVTAEGGYVGTLSADGLGIPHAFGPGGLMAYIEADDLDVQTVRVLRLEGLAR